MIKTTLYLLIGIAFLFCNVESQCLQCTSENNGDCNNPNGNGYSRGCEGGTAHCYVRVVDGRVIRGCQKDLSTEVLSHCSQNEDEATCRTCNSTNCNGGLFPPHRIFCHHCDERKEDGNCTQKIEGTPFPCRTYQANDQCIVRQHGDHVIRECLSDYEDCSKEKSCQKCDSHGCNNEEYKGTGTTVTFSMLVIAGCLLMTNAFY
ncbi:uncharacterized protein LOC134828113 [Culicoides brevitarsis]|uniref:uncharacterized protein LOC134828113 n=1 Tax=Culicoides brevitarsis TaxID=469753 RepID=UPI00307C21CB